MRERAGDTIASSVLGATSGWSRGGVRERPNRHAWKACVGQPTVGSNPTPSARSVDTVTSTPELDDDAGAMAIALDEARAARRPRRRARRRRGARRRAGRGPGRQRAGAATATRPPTPSCSRCAARRGRAGHVAARRGHARGHARAVPDVRRGAARAPGCSGSCSAPPTPRTAPCGTLYNLCVDPRLNHEVEVVHGVRGRGGRRPARRLLRRPPAVMRLERPRGRRLTSPTESCQSGRMGRSRKPLWVSAHRGFESHALRHPTTVGPHHSASSPFSPVRTRVTESRGMLQIFPSPIFRCGPPRRSASTILSTTRVDGPRPRAAPSARTRPCTRSPGRSRSCRPAGRSPGASETESPCTPASAGARPSPLRACAA